VGTGQYAVVECSCKESPIPSLGQAGTMSTKEVCGEAAQPRLKLGFVGCGTISAAIVRGLCRGEGKASTSEAQLLAPAGAACGVVSFPILVSRRSEAKSAALVTEFGPDLVRVCDSNEELVASSDIVVIGLTPSVRTCVDLFVLLLDLAAVCTSLYPTACNE
jgi:ornithine cyclodeaminase/alanine dehydrogenase-like protein (mu-crystallin family)